MDIFILLDGAGVRVSLSCERAL